MIVICSRKTVGVELGDFLVDGEIFKGAKVPSVRAVLLLNKIKDLSDGYSAKVVGGCKNGLELHSLESTVSVTQAKDGPKVIRSLENG